jgi:hypothetical protein
MAEPKITQIRLKTEIDQDKVDDLRAALEQFDDVSQAMRQSISRVQEAVFAMNDAITIRREDVPNGSVPQEPS